MIEPFQRVETVWCLSGTPGAFSGGSCSINEVDRHGLARPLRTSFARLCCLAGLLLAPVTRAQHVFVVLEDGRPQVVRDVRYGHAQIEVDGELRSAEGTQFALREAAIYGPGLITVSNFQVQSYHVGVEGDSTQLNPELKIRGAFQSENDLEQCFVVLNLTTEWDEGVVFAEMPNLVAGKTKRLDLAFPLNRSLGDGRMKVHFFSRGFEILHSRMRAGHIKEQKQKTTEFLTRPSDQPVKLIQAVKPQYPDGLPDGNAPGSAKVRCLIDAEGKVAEVTLIECSHPAYGEAAMAAVRQWTFDPAIKNHEPVATTVDIPFDFKPPIQPAADESGDAPAPTP